MGTKEQATVKQTLGKILDAEKLRYCFDCGICTACCSISDMFGRDAGSPGEDWTTRIDAKRAIIPMNKDKIQNHHLAEIVSV